jgi:hypothetical protein
MKKIPTRRRAPLFEVRHSPIHGHGVFAARRIRKGTTIIEYLGDRVTHAQADARYEDKDPDDNHTFLFTVDAKTVIDAGVGGNDARFINHGCDPNCESTTLKKRIYIEAIRTIQRDSDDAPNVDEIYACRCGAKSCRGSMLEPAKKPRKNAHKAAQKAAQKAARKAAQKTARNGARQRVAAKRVAGKKAVRQKTARTRGRRG